MKIIYQEEKSCRIDKYLIGLRKDELYSRSFIEHLIKDGNITVNQEKVKKSYLLHSGDEVYITIPQKSDLEITPQNIPLDIVWQDEYLAVINKQAGIAVHPGAGNPDGTIVNTLMYHLKGQLSSAHDPLRPGIVHRLDKDTTGLLIVAKDDKTHSLLSQQFQNWQIQKIYKAITVGIPKTAEGTIETYIERSLKDRTRMAVSDSGRIAVTHYKIEKYFDFFSLVDIQLETGRTHQIRVHFSHINCPILGDNTYSTLKRTLSIVPFHYQKKVKYLLANHLKRQALHACRLEFKHPITGKEIKVEAPLPEDMDYTLNWLKENFVTE
jgi:23S rRNA pseudouridine1911/1915/1917 synthase